MPKLGGWPLPRDVQTKMERALAANFADVRIHMGPEAPAIGAIAFAWGSNIHFAPGNYNPHTQPGQRLLAHELVHVIQQRSGKVANPFGGGVAVVQDRALEAEAERLAQQAVGNGSVALIVSTRSVPAAPLHIAPPLLKRAPAPVAAPVGQTQIKPTVPIHARHSVQRAVGFEFEVDEVTTFRKTVFRRREEPLKKKDKLLVKPGLFSVEADVRENGTSDMEIVTEPFPETREGGKRLTRAMAQITAFVDELKRLTPGTEAIPASRLAGFGNPVGNRWFKPRTNKGYDTFLAKPQATAGIRLLHLNRLLGDIENGPADLPARVAIGGRSRLSEDQAGSIPIAAARQAASRELANTAPPEGHAWSHKLVGLLTLLAAYMSEGNKGVSGYAKTIANPIMARTDFAAIYNQLPLVERDYFRDTRGEDTWLNLVLGAAATICGERIFADGAVFSGGLYTSQAAYGATDLHPADPRFKTNPLPPLSRRRWLEGIAFEKIDRLTARNYPGSRRQRAELESLGSYGNTVDYFGRARYSAPIFEFRGLENRLPYTLWFPYALSFFRYIRAVNLGDLEGWRDTVDEARHEALYGRQGERAQRAARLEQYALAREALADWA